MSIGQSTLNAIFAACAAKWGVSEQTVENEYNGGMGSNGLTSARHDVFHKEYANKYPDSYEQNTPDDVVYLGSKRLTDPTEVAGVNAGKLVLSPTRTYIPLIKKIIDNHRESINGMIHCTGGAQTKVMKFLDKNLRIIKDNLLPIPPLFKMIKDESGLDYKEMYQVFNMGHRLEVYTPSKETAESMIALAKEFNIDAQIIGRAEKNDSQQLVIENEFGHWEY